VLAVVTPLSCCIRFDMVRTPVDDKKKREMAFFRAAAFGFSRAAKIGQTLC
jgi:hypothetical protein